MLRPGMFLQDRYEIVEQIGSGGMSVVYKAKCHKLNRLVAIKVLKEEFSSDANFVSKFKLEAQAAAGLSHPNIVNVYDVIDEGSIHYIVMELIEGITLKNYIAKKGCLEIKESIGIAIQVAQGIAAAHEQHIIHRDIKPQNMIISRDGKVKVADFGIARAVSAQTLSSAAMGSVHYISPEQARGGYSDARSDIYSLGITMYEMVTGRVPFEGDNTVAIALAHLEDPITPPSVYNPEIPVSMEKIILKCTEKKPERRYNTAMEVISDLRKALITPEDDFVKNAPPADFSSQTVTISPPELAKIREGRNPGQSNYNNAGNSGKKKEDPGDINPKIEKILSGVGVAVAIIIVAVLLFIFSRLGGLFRSGTPGDNAETQTTVAVTAQETLSSKQVLMPDVETLTEEMAKAKLADSFLSMKIEYEISEEIEKGIVISQLPEVDSVVDKYSTVTVIISNGSDKIDLAALNLPGTDVEAAKSLLETQKLVVVVERQNNDTVPKERVIGIAPDSAKEGETVTLYVSIGPATAKVMVPNIVGQTEEIAVEMISEIGLVPGTATAQSSNDVPKGTVIGQAVAADSQLDTGAAINYTVSSGPEHKTYKYLASIDTTYALKNIIGPGSGTIELSVKVRLKQTVNGKAEYRELIEPVKVTGDTLLPISFTNLEGAVGVDRGELEIVNADSGEVLNAYPLTFIAVPQS